MVLLRSELKGNTTVVLLKKTLVGLYEILLVWQRSAPQDVLEATDVENWPTAFRLRQSRAIL